MRARFAGLLTALALCALPACGGQAAIRTDQPAHLVEDLARRLIEPARHWLKEEEARDESATLGHPSSAEMSTLAINFQRLVEQARAQLEPFLPRETRGLPVPADLSKSFRMLATSLGTAAPEDVSAAEESRTPNSARVRLTIAPPDGAAQTWILTLTREDETWRFTAAPRRG